MVQRNVHCFCKYRNIPNKIPKKSQTQNYILGFGAEKSAATSGPDGLFTNIRPAGRNPNKWPAAASRCQPVQRPCRLISCGDEQFADIDVQRERHFAKKLQGGLEFIVADPGNAVWGDANRDRQFL